MASQYHRISSRRHAHIVCWHYSMMRYARNTTAAVFTGTQLRIWKNMLILIACVGQPGVSLFNRLVHDLKSNRKKVLSKDLSNDAKNTHQ